MSEALKRYREEDPVTIVPGIGAAIHSNLDRLGIRTVGDLLDWYPRVYIDGSHPRLLAEVPADGLAAVRVKIVQAKVRPAKARGVRLTDAVASDPSGATVTLRWFNQPYLLDKLQPGSEHTAIGRLTRFGCEVVMASPILEIEPRILPVYGQTKGVSSKMLRGYVEAVLGKTELAEDLPPAVRARENLLGREAALRMLHRPQTMADVEAARRHVAFAEAFRFFLRLLLSRRESGERGIPIPYRVEDLQALVASLPFELTAGQKKAVWDSVKDMAGGQPMTRLVNGDVGSGKTAVAGLVAAIVAKDGFQSVILAPTDILARQHRESLSRLLGSAGLRVALWTAATKEEATEADLIVGTHAVLQERFALPRLALVVVDEQHRFGVRQRQALRQAQALPPHLLSMTATPIPRTLALALYGDLAVSFLPEKPKDRKPVITRTVRTQRERIVMHQRILEEVRTGHQVFVICPLIEEKRKAGEEELLEILTEEERQAREKKTVVAEVERLRRVHPEYGTIEAVHGRMKPKEKEAVMARMVAGETNVLVATSVIEVGVDVPNATVMVIEGAERFGLAQLHQFRGRVGRGKDQAYCFLYPEQPSRQAAERLAVLEESDSGFTVAERDLALRGPGELAGLAQSGLPDFRMASLTDLDFLARVKEAAHRFIKEESESALRYAALPSSGGTGGLE